MTGICTSISTASKRSRSSLSSATAPFFGDGDVVAPASEQAAGDTLIDDVVFHQEQALRRLDAIAREANRRRGRMRRPRQCRGRRRRGGQV